jgi:hypothetical protein
MARNVETGSAKEIPLAPRSKRRVLIETAVAYALILIVIWTPRPAQRWLWWVAAAAVIAFTCVFFDGAKAMGLRGANFLRSIWVVAAALLIAAIAVAIAARLHTLLLQSGPIAFIKAYFAYAIWAFAQQFLLQSFFLLRCLRLFPSPRTAAIAAAAIFALAHLPNPILTPITLVWGIAACFLFLRYRNLFPLAIAHAIFGITIAITVPGYVDHNMRVGLSYLTYSRHAHRTPHAYRAPAR